MRFKLLTTLLFALLALAGGFGGSALYNQLIKPQARFALADTPLARVAEINPIPVGGINFSQAARVAIPSVVFIKTEAGEQPRDMMDMFFYGNPGKQVSSGSGVIFSSNGYIVTNNHVVEGAEKIEIQHQKRTYPAKIIGVDPSTDLALLKVEGTAFPAVKISDSRKVSVGEWVLAVGNPFNLTSTVTAGIISAKGRNINLLSGQFPIESFIQTDAAINPGNSGGALVNAKGELVGINTAIFSKTGSYTGYGFAVPSDIVKKVVEDLIKYGTVQKGFVGADIAEVDGALADRLKQPLIEGVAITRIQDDGPAAKAGLRIDDVVLKINTQTISGKGVFDEEISYYNPGDRVTVQYRRSGKVLTAALTLTNREGTTELLKRSIFQSKTIGADLEAISKVERDKYGVESGVRVVKAHANGFVRRLGLDEGFVIVSVNRQPMHEPREVEQALSNAQGRTIMEGIDRNGQKGNYTFGY